MNTSTIEGYYSILERSTKAVYHHCSGRHQYRDLPEFDFRYGNRVKVGLNGSACWERALPGIVGKRLMHRDSWAVGG
jgi:hypothetical protein